ncbi:Hypothetical predicted protein [Pelobates cultripes]|uniref:L1 transposable element RRM domain-containing protein n=1 Tax=Pelobates cultripes TaxID=61616 RepID=A0AAD1SGQ0_PELCU|nr:Hypothetical predicted protein [Pelobates cultripes]
MAGGKKKKELPPSVATLFRTPGEAQRPTQSNHEEDKGSDSEWGAHTPTPLAPLTIGVLQSLLREATADIKTHVAEEISKQLTGLRADVEALTTCTDQTEVRLTTLATASTAQSQEISYLHGRLTAMEDSLEDLNNRSRRNNIRIRGLPESIPPESLMVTLKGIFAKMAPEIPSPLLEIDSAHRALRPRTLNIFTPRDVIIRLHYFQTKEKIMQIARIHPPQYAGAHITLFQDLAPTTLKKRQDLKPLTLALQERGIKYTWGHPFKLLIRKEDQTHILISAAEIGPMADSLGIQLLNQTTLSNYRGRDRSRDRPRSPRPAKQQRFPQTTKGIDGERHEEEIPPPHRQN